MHLRSQMILGTVAVIIAITLGTGLYFAQRERNLMERMTEQNVEAMRAELRTRGFTLASNIALACERAITVLDFLFLSEMLASTVRNDKDVLYGILMTHDGIAQVHTRTELAGTTLTSPMDVFAQTQTKMASQDVVFDKQAALEAIAPIVVGDKPWGVVRLGMSLNKLNAQIEGAKRAQRESARNNVLVGSAVALIMLIVGTVAATWLARRLSRPLEALTAGVDQIRSGNLGATITGRGAVEFVTLASSFNTMTASLKERDEALRNSMNDLVIALDRAEEASRLKSEFLANISHELRTPLNSIVNVPVALLKDYVETIAWACPGCGAEFTSDAEGQEPDAIACPDCAKPLFKVARWSIAADIAAHRHFLGRLNNAATHLLNLVNELLDFSKLEAGKMKLYRENVALDGLMRESVGTIAGLAHDKEIHLDYAGFDPAALISVDQVKFSQVVINLLGNAIKFTERGGTISVNVAVEARGEHRYYRVVISDTGCGIPSDKLQEIFVSFRQVDGGHTRRHGGTGLGLAITKQLIELHGGAIWATSELGQGSSFTFVLPEREEYPSYARIAASGEETRGLVLVVDDSQAQLELARLVIEQEGYAVQLVPFPRDALRLAKDLAPSVVLLDIMMPETSGIDVLKQLRADPATRHIPVVVSTAYHTNEEICLKLGAIWLPKPWERTHLVRVLRECSIERMARSPANESIRELMSS